MVGGEFRAHSENKGYGGGAVIATTLVGAPQVPGLSPADQDLVNYLVQQIQWKSTRNSLRHRYYDYHNALRDLGIAIPPQLKSVETVVGWPAKAVDSIARRVVLDDFTFTDGTSTADMGLDVMLEANRWQTMVPQTHTSALIHSCAFGFVTAGDVTAGEPPVLITAKSAEWATGTWDQRTRRLSNALSVVSVDEKTGAPTEMVLYVPNRAVIMRRDGQTWDIRQSIHDLGVPAEVLPYRAALDRPFGSSRISRPVMALTDSGVRTLLRTEVSAEFYNAPQRYALGAEEGAFTDADGNTLTGWQVMLGRLLTLTRDEEGEMPQVGQFPQQSMEPNIAHFRMLAQAFASETSLPLRALGVVGDNPESADAISQAEKELDLEIQHWESASLGPAWSRLARLGLRMIDDSPAARATYATLRPIWHDQETSSRAAKADAFTKNAAVIPDLASTTVGLEMSGMTRDQIERYQSERRRAAAGTVLDRLLRAKPTTTPAAPVQ